MTDAMNSIESFQEEQASNRELLNLDPITRVNRLRLRNFENTQTINVLDSVPSVHMPKQAYVSRRPVTNHNGTNFRMSRDQEQVRR